MISLVSRNPGTTKVWLVRSLLYPAAILLLLAPQLRAQKTAAPDEVVHQVTSSPVTDYQIGNGDVLQISVWGEPQLARSVTVRPDGKVSLPLIADLTVSGMTALEVQHVLHDKYMQFLKHPDVSVLVAEVHSKLVYVTGEVQRPGAYSLTGTTTVVQIIARAGGVTDFAKTKKVYILRRPDGRRIPVNLKAALDGHQGDQDLEVSSGDTVVVP